MYSFLHPAAFQFTPLREGRLDGTDYLLGELLFQFTPLREGRPVGISDATRRLYFNSRPSARGDTTAALTLLDEFHFNSRPSARGDRNKSQLRLSVIISIHAPPRGATSPCHSVTRHSVFQFTPLREGRLLGGCTKARGVYFNSRPSARGDPELARCIDRSGISIHAPPRGATSTYYIAPMATSISIHAPPRGATHAWLSWRTGKHEFQFTPLREGRRFRRTSRCAGMNFNSRPSARGDLPNGHVVPSGTKFQFTPLREGRRGWGARCCWL